METNLFMLAHVDAGGYEVVWTDQIDIAEVELWIYGVLA
jgi:hypothetical protein